MRILLINNWFRDVGGVERVFFLERKMWQERGHEIVDFSTLDERNDPSPHEKYFVRGFDFQQGTDVVQQAARFFYSYEVDQKLSALIRDTRPDVAHIHGIFDQLGPTVLAVLERYKIPVVFTAHAYKLICPNWKLFAHGQIDEGCKNNPWHDAWNKSIQGSLIKSLGAAMSWYFMKRRGVFDGFARIISPSKFLIDKHVEFGWERERFIHLPNPLNVLNVERINHEQNQKGPIVFVGRLALEKGVGVLLAAARLLPEKDFVIVGDGPEFKNLKAAAEKCSNVIFVGAKSPAEARAYVARASAVVVPSIWYENDPYAVLDAQAAGAIVVAAHIGGIPEQIQHGVNGFLFEPGNEDALAEILRHVSTLSVAERTRIGSAARGFVDTLRNPELYFEALLEVVLSIVKA